MTQLEQRIMGLAITALRKYIEEDEREPNWEQRRYEIARDLYVRNGDYTAEKCVEWADELIAELKKKKED